MRQQGWITERRGEDRRERRLRLDQTEEALLRRALPRWERVQARLRRQIGEQAWKEMARWTDRVASAALSQSPVESKTRSSTAEPRLTTDN